MNCTAINWLLDTGTFAVVSLMIGQVVEKADCYGYKASTSDQSVGGDGDSNLTTAVVDYLRAENDSFLAGVSAATPSEGGSKNEYVAQCQIETAFAVTLVVGFYQVALHTILITFYTGLYVSCTDC